MVLVDPAAKVLELHWAAAPESPEGFPFLVSQIRTGVRGL
jgi:hypothetical protein